jgi:hypothetical protein
MALDVVDNRVYSSLGQIRDTVIEVLLTGEIPYIEGDPGLGKSAFYESIAKEYNLELIDFRLSQIDQTDLLGLLSKENGRTIYAPPKRIPLEGDPLPEGKDGWLLLFDELPLAHSSVMKAVYQIFHDKMCGDYHIHERVRMASAGNGIDSRAMACKLPSTIQSRLITFAVKSNVQEWCEVAETKDFDHRIVSFVRFTGQVNNFREVKEDVTFMCERTLEKASKFIKGKEVSSAMKVMLAGTIGLGKATEFIGYCQIYKGLVTIQEILDNPTTANVPSDPQALFAITGSLSKHITVDNIKGFLPYILRLPIEFQSIALKGAVRKNKDIMYSPEFTKWQTANALRLTA